MKKILFMCVANSARSQLADGLGLRLLGDIAEIRSAGSHPSKMNPYAAKALSEIGIDSSKQYSKSVDDLAPEFVAVIDYVITLCAEEVCPVIVSRAKRLHWPLPDPAGKGGTDEEQLQRFRDTRNEIERRLKEFRAQVLKA